MCFYLVKLCYPATFLTFGEVMYITFYGMIRGAVAFANIINFPQEPCVKTGECAESKYYQLYKSSALMVVAITTLLFGSFMSLAKKVFFRKFEDLTVTKDVKSPVDTAKTEKNPEFLSDEILS